VTLTETKIARAKPPERGAVCSHDISVEGIRGSDEPGIIEITELTEITEFTTEERS
jgi:hypothetical protein